MASTNTTHGQSAHPVRDVRGRHLNAAHFDRWALWLGLFSFAAVLLRCFCIARWQIQCPSHWPVSIGILGFAVAMLWQITAVIQAMHSKRGRSLAWGRLLFVLTPLLLSTWGIVHVSRITSVRYIPDGLPLRLVGPFAISLFDIESRWRYSHVYKGNRISMFAEKPVKFGNELVQEADAFLEHLEQKLGRKGNARGRWVRGSLLGRNNSQVLGWIMSDHFEAESDTVELTELDKHEIAHFAAHQFLGTVRMPPTFLIEGWAQYCSISTDRIASQAYDARHLAGQVWSVDRLSSRPWRSIDKGPVYSVGAAWVAYLCETIGSKTFGDLFIQSGDQDFVELVSRILKKDISEIESDVWNWVERTRSTEMSVKLVKGDSDILLTPEESDALSSSRIHVRPTFQKLASETGGGVYWKETIESANENQDDRLRVMTREYWIFPTEKWMLGDVFFQDRPVLFALLANGETLALEKSSQGWVAIDDMKGITDIRDYLSQFFIQAESSLLVRTVSDYLTPLNPSGWDLQSKNSDDQGRWQIVMQTDNPVRQKVELTVDPSLQFAVRELHLKTEVTNDAKAAEANLEYWIDYEKDELLGTRIVGKRTRRDWGVPDKADDSKVTYEWKLGEDVRLPNELPGLNKYSIPYEPNATTPLEILIALSAASTFLSACYVAGTFHMPFAFFPRSKKSPSPKVVGHS